MKKIDKILVCVDFSQYTRMAMESAVAIARGTQAQIVVFNVINQRDVNSVQQGSGHV